jgi:hypothetical protein
MRARLLLSAAALAAFGGSLFGGFHLDDYAIFSSGSPRVSSVGRIGSRVPHLAEARENLKRLGAR